MAIAALLLSAGAASATPFSITTTGTITSGSDSANLLGAGTSLVGDSYTLTVNYNGIGPGYFTDGSGQFATDFGDQILGSVRVRIGQNTTSTTIAKNSAPSLTEDTSDLIASNGGNDAAGNFASGSQSITAVSNFISIADLQTAFGYTLKPGDTGLDQYTLANAANTRTASFSGTTASVQFALQAAVPEPATWGVLVAGLLGLGWARRRAIG